MKLDTNLDVEWLQIDPSELSEGTGNKGMSVTTDSSKAYLCFNGVSVIDNTYRSYYVLRINSGGTGLLRGTEIYRTGKNSESRCRIHRYLTTIVTVAEAKDAVDPTKSSLMLVKIQQGSMGVTGAKAKDGGGVEDFNMDSVLDTASGNIYTTSQTNGKLVN